MDRERFVLQFEALEKKVDRLIDVCKAYKTDNLELTNKIKRLEEELQARVEAESAYRAERAEIRSKVDHLLSRLEDFSDL